MWRERVNSRGLQPAARVVLVCALVALADATVYACPICFQVEDANAAQGVRTAVVVLVGVTVTVLAGVVRFAVRVARAQSKTGASSE